MLEIAAVFITITALFAWFNYRFIKLPATIGVMFISLVASVLLIVLSHTGFDAITDWAEAWLGQINFNALLMDGMLSFLLFAGALHVDITKLKRYRYSIGFLATIGVVISTLAVGSAAWWLFRTFHIDVPYLYCLVFGALIAPTDPIAVLGIMRSAGAPEDMEIKIVGESLFNDGVAVVVFTMMLGAATATETLTVMHSATLFLEEAGGGALLGLVMGYVAYWLMKSIDQYQIEVLVSLALVLGGYTLATHLQVSGPISMVIAGLFIGNRGREHAMSDTTRRYVDGFWELIDEILNAVLFVLIGLELLLIPFEWSYLIVAGPVIVVILATRLITIGLPLMTLKRWIHYRPGTTQVLTWGGLRGGISVALALGLPESDYRNTIVMVTYIIVLFSILAQGLTIGRLVQRVLSRDSKES
ncbi:cation:proton antiporter [Chromohalobacter sarecensis]|uniref:Cation:proton antiporter n=1 Tax=Chromohalobacter sarecensis TaxID=245294 RepID=A0ABV9D256_9GAMM|nr:sodium:proton antiporter [Chromohalobacter sarecensis]MCK0715361.1 sodium:proton antiporter [Chromohalobacter sarecensis]